MSIPKELLHLTGGLAPGFCVYGGIGLKKSHATHTLPPKILYNDFEQGSASLLPWIDRIRDYNSTQWTQYSQQDRESFYNMTPEQGRSRITPAPFIDVISYDALNPESYNIFKADLAIFNPTEYSSYVLDSLQEFSEDTKTFTKFTKWGAQGTREPMEGLLWGGAQERAAISLRCVKSFRSQGVVVYLIGSEQIDKDYVNDPRSKKQGEAPEEPYSVKGTVNVPGKLVGIVPHLVDVVMHAKSVNSAPIWVTQPEAMPGGVAHWEAKDRFGRISEKYVQPNFRKLFDYIYGQEGKVAIYKSWRREAAA